MSTDNLNPQDDLIEFNGIDATTGDYLISPINEQDAARIATSQPQDQNITNAIRNVARLSGVEHLGAAFDISLEDVTQAGWAVVFHQNEDQQVKAALDPLIKHRRDQIGDSGIVKVLEYRDGDSVIPWLARHKLKFGLIEPEKVPFYVLIVGS
ncbi:MAG: hypothetical protein ACREAB_13155, partial [Blastocatellia bacterium]